METEEIKRHGRRPYPPHMIRAIHPIRFTDAEWSEVESAASDDGHPEPARWARERLLAVARREVIHSR